MSKSVHAIYIWSLVSIVVLVTIYLTYTGYSYYLLPIEERFYHPRHDWFKPSGAYGHGIGILGTFMILFGVVIYIARKRYNFLVKYLRLKYLLEFHIFLCTLGPILVLFHTSFKFGGIVSVAFWSMVAVVASGVIGRFIYIQIPRTIEGRELSLNEVKSMKVGLSGSIKGQTKLNEELIEAIVKTTDEKLTLSSQLSYTSKFIADRSTIASVKQTLKQQGVSGSELSVVLSMVRNEIQLSNKIARLQTMQKLFKYWHVAHLPFALIMLIILIVHVAVTLAFGYRWIF